MLKLRNLIFLIIILAVGAGYFVLQHRINQMAKENIDNALSQVKPWADVKYKTVHGNLFTGTVTLKDITVRAVISPDQPPVMIKSIAFNMGQTDDEIVTSLNVNAKRIEVPIDTSGMNATTQAFFKQLNAKSLVSDLRFDYKYDVATKDMALVYDHKVDNLGNVNLNASFANVPPSANNYMQYNDAQLRSLEAVYQDMSLVPRLLTVGAEQEGISKEAYITEIMADINKNIAAQSNQYMKDGLAQWELFLKDPKQFTIKMLPAKPVALGTLQSLSPDEVAKQLNLEIKGK